MTTCTHRSTRPAGFTLIEVMIVVAIIGLLATLAYPSYRDSVSRSRRADAKAVLMETVQWIERQYTISNAYDKKSDGTTLTDNELPVREAPRDGAAKYYDIKYVGTPTAAAYTLQAIPKNSMTGDVCGSLTLDQAGTRGVTGSATVDSCWPR